MMPEKKIQRPQDPSQSPQQAAAAPTPRKRMPWESIAPVALRQPKYARANGMKVTFTDRPSTARWVGSLHGGVGEGKTLCASTAPGNSYFLATEQATVDALAGAGLSVPYKRVTTYDDVVRLVPTLPDRMRAVGSRTLVIDTWSTLSDAILSQELETVRGYYGGGDAAYSPDYEMLIWNEVLRKQLDLRMRVEGLHCSVLYVCHTRDTGDEDSVPDAQGSYRARLLRYPSFTFYLRHDNVRDVRYLITRTADGVVARCKWPGLDLYEPADLSYVIAKASKAIEAMRGPVVPTTEDKE